MPAFRQSNSRGGGIRGGRGGRGRPGQQSRGGPRLPSALNDELGLPSQKKKEYGKSDYKTKEDAPFRKNAGFRSNRPEEARPTPTSFRSKPLVEEKLTKRKRNESEEPEDKPVKKPSTSNVLVTSEPTYIRSEGERRKIDKGTSTALSRMLAKQKGRSRGRDEEEESDLEEEEEGPSSKAGSSSSKLKAKDETPLDPSIMNSAFSGRGKKAEKDEEQEIAWLEWKLGGKGKKPKKSVEEDDEFEDDGLDDLLNFADEVAYGKSSKSSKGKEPASAFDSEDEAMDFGSDLEDDMDEDAPGFETEEAMDDLEEEEMDDLEGKDDLQNFYTDDDEEADLVLKWNTEMNAARPEVESVEPMQNPATTVVAPVSTGKYIPPSLRKAQQVAQPAAEGSTPSVAQGDAALPKTDAQVKLGRKIKGLLNKLSEANIESILADVEGLYRESSRHDVTATLTDMIINTISDRANLLDSFVILYATFVSALYKIKGADLGGHFLQTAITRYATTLAAAQSHSATPLNGDIEDPGKQPLNILTLVSELYNFQVVGCLLIYDLVKGFIEDLGTSGFKGEFAVEGVLRVLRCSGQQLRADDPTALKDIVNLVQTKTSGQDSNLSARGKFMVETLTNVKNNKLKNLPGGQGQVAAETTTKMKKFLGGLGKKRHVLAHEPLRVTLADIQTASTRGKWWIVGAAWSGDPVRERERARQAALEAQGSERKTIDRSVLDVLGGEEGEDETDLIGLGVGKEEELLRLARRQGMNTDVRRQVFMVMMTSDDYTHACDRLAGLKFSEVQQREFVRVALHCLAIEPPFNPYYALILSHLTSTSYSHRFTLQYALWDFLRDLGQDEVGGEGTRGDVRGTSTFGAELSGGGKRGEGRVGRVGMGLGWVVSQGGIDLTVFKPVDFTSLQPNSILFFQYVFTHLVLSLHTRSPSFQLSRKQLRNPEAHSLTEDTGETIQAIFVKTISAGGMELAQGVRYFLTRVMGIKQTGKEGKRFGLVLDTVGVRDERMRGVVWHGLRCAEEVLGKMM